MKLKLHQLEAAVRKQFTWVEDPKTRWANDPVHNCGVKGMGACVFIGLAIQFGYDLQSLYDYLDLEEKDITAKLKMFNAKMREMLERKLTGTALDKRDVTLLMSLKKDMVISYLRLQLKEYLPLNNLKH